MASHSAIARTALPLAFSGAVLVGLLSGCSSSSGDSNRENGAGTGVGGDITCGEFIAQDSAARTETMKVFLQQQGHQNPNDAEITAINLTMQTYCNVTGSKDTKLRLSGE
ncbi:hypothetical protein [Tomitella biformata]|uniref:hypothetical protein n=1 Tax=Tomitella biformata TaxID=630403 RepID=UPI000467A77B|nr:hypothetical protein [Tomitella biformata]